MRVSFSVYGVLYVVIEMVGYQLEAIGWLRITALAVASAVTNALRWVSLVAAVVVGVDVGAERWRAHRREQERVPAWAAWRRGSWDADAWDAPITVTSWRSPVLALPAAPAPDETPHVRLL